MITFEQLIMKLKLRDGKNELVDGMVLYLQYYSFTTSQWTNAFSGIVEKGELLIVGETAVRGNVAEMDLYALIEDGKLPQIRIIPRDKLAGSGIIMKQPIIASSFEFYQDAVDGKTQFVLDFGTLHILPVELIADSSSNFDHILPLTNYFPVTKPEAPPVPIQDLYANIVSEIASATDTASDSPFKLANISLKLKAMVHRDGESINASLLTLANSEHVNGNAISELVFDIAPVSNRNDGGISVPNLTGLTETAVRKVLKPLGLKLNPVYQKKIAVVNGDSFKQFPPQGTSTEANQLITVIFSKHE